MKRRSLLRGSALALTTLTAQKTVSSAFAQSAPVDNNPKRARLEVTENPYGPAPAARRAVAESVPYAPYYVEDESELRKRIAGKENLADELIALSNGSLDALSLLTCDIARGGCVLAPHPTYVTHLNYAQRRGIPTNFVPLRDHQIDFDAMRKAITTETRLVYFCNPNNPTGQMIDHDALIDFCRDMAPRFPVMIDEAYYELLPDYQRMTMVPLVREGLDVIVTRTFSKVYGMAGLRIGYILAQSPRVKQLYSLTTTSRNQPGYRAALASLGDEAYLKGAVTYLTQCREIIYRLCHAHGLGYLPSVGTFVYVDTHRPATAMQDGLARYGVDVRVFADKQYESWIRIGTATPREIAMLAKVLPQVIEEVPLL
ncbi:histidinol-phosphate transaminase [Asaia sp. BMEF1]|uniref:pyridoxal phosphate-dependent aminotransferase n=1 Tax=Asaia sp. BMEF1 TaxID=3155932 RepID=UPI003F67146E